MFMHAITSPIFMAGLTVYLNRYADSVAVEEDLFTAIQETVSLSKLQLPDGFTVAAAMSSWTRQSGFPLVDVQRKFGRDFIHTAALSVRSAAIKRLGGQHNMVDTVQSGH